MTVSWLGLAVTIAGFAIALHQLRRIKTASEASAEAGRQVLSLVRERENLTELVAAAGYVDSIRTYINLGQRDGATIYIELLRSKLIYLREMLPADDISGSEISKSLVNLTLIADQLRNPPTARTEIRQLVTALVPISDLLQGHIARRRFTPSNLP